MYHAIQGLLQTIFPAAEEAIAVLENPSGVSYEVHVGPQCATALPIGTPVKLYTTLIVRENEQFLVGFESQEDCALYRILIRVSGVGPKQGLRLLDQLSANEMKQAIRNQDVNSIARVKGIGKKTAEKLILELHDKVQKMPHLDSETPPTRANSQKTEALMALRALGYQDNEAKRMVDSGFEQHDFTGQSTEAIVVQIIANLR